MITIKGLARELNLSASAVSRALSNEPERVKLVSAGKRERILRAAREKGYRRNRHAEYLQQGKSATIGVFVPEICDRLMCELVFGIAETAFRHGFPVNIHPGMDSASYEEFIRANLNNPGVGIISYPTTFDASNRSRELLVQYRRQHGKILLLNSATPEKGMPSLAMDEAHGGRLAAEALQEHDCDLYVHCGATRYVARQRMEGFVAALKDKRVQSVPRGADPAFWRRLLRQHARIGVFARHDRAASGYIADLRRVEARFGENAFIVGYDNMSLSEHLDPALTTIVQPFREEGRLAVEMLLASIYGKKTENRLLKPSLLRRASA